MLLGTWFWRRLLPEVAGLFAPAHDDAIFGADAAGIIKARADGAERHAFGRCGLADFLAFPIVIDAPAMGYAVRVQAPEKRLRVVRNSLIHRHQRSYLVF